MEQVILIQMSERELKELMKGIVKEVIEQVTPKEKRYYNREQVAEKFMVSLATIHSYINEGKIVALKIGGRTLFDADEIDKAAQEKKVLRYAHRRN